MAADNHKSQSKQAEDEGVFFWFGDDLAVDDHSHRSVACRRKPGIRRAIIIEGPSRKEVADGLVDDARAHPSRRIPGGVGQSASRDANPYCVLHSIIIIHEKMGNGSVDAGDGDGRRVGSVGGKSDVGSAASRNSGSHRSDVYRVGAGKQGRKLKVGRSGLVGVVKVAVVFLGFPSVSPFVIIA